MYKSSGVQTERAGSADIARARVCILEICGIRVGWSMGGDKEAKARLDMCGVV